MVALVVYILSFLASLGLGVFIIFRNYFGAKKQSDFYFGAVAISLSWWLFCLIFSDNSKDERVVFLWTQLAILGPSFLTYFWLQFTLFFTGKETGPQTVRSFLLAIPALIILLLSPTELNVQKVFVHDWGSEVISGMLYIFLFIFIIGYFSFSFWKLYQAYRKGEGLLKLQVLYVLVGALITLVIGLTTNLILVVFGYSQFSVFGPPSALFFIGFTTYSIFRYRLFDIQVQLQKVFNVILPLIVVALLGAVMGIYSNRYGYGMMYMGVLILVAGSLAYKFLYDVLEKTPLGHLLSRRSFNFQKSLRDLSREAAKIIDLNHLSRKIIEVFSEEMMIKKVVLAVPRLDKPNELVVLSRSEAIKSQRSFSRIPKSFVRYISTTKKVLLADELKIFISDQTRAQERRVNELLLGVLEEKKMNICLPLLIEDSLIGILFLGIKERDRAYTVDDIALLEEASKELAIALLNATSHYRQERQAQILRREVLRQTNEIRKLFEMKNEFLAVASHQLRTPTAILYGMLSMLANDPLPKEKREDFIQKCFIAANRLQAVIRDLLSVTEMETGKIQVAPEEVSIKELIKQTIAELELQIQGKPIRVVLKPIKIKSVQIDPKLTKEVISSFIDNAIKYTPEGKVEISVEDKKNKFIVHVKDNGIGISKKDMKKLFSKFVRAEKAIQIRPSGTGLGLYLSKLVTEAQGGKVMVESSGEGKGSTFSVVLPKKVKKS